jgi:hypothetical protein
MLVVVFRLGGVDAHPANRVHSLARGCGEGGEVQTGALAVLVHAVTPFISDRRFHSL